MKTSLQSLDHASLLAVALRVLEDVGPAPFTHALEPDEPPKKKKRKEKKKKAGMDMSRYEQRPIALWICYDGGAYSGLAEQNLESDSVDTVERQLFMALKKTCLIESREACGYSRCGRTDKGVSALCQVVGLRVRSAARAGEGGVGPLDAHAGDALPDGKHELDYVTMLNRVLPDDIRALAWRAVVPEFSARFSCASRTYRYFFSRESPKTSEAYDVDAMRDAAARLVGVHDFRNFCKMDVLHVKNFRRVVYSAAIHEEGSGLYFEIHGQAFLWHMVRSLVAVLFLVGDGREAPTIVDELLDVDTCPRKPQYLIADERPLVLHRCDYDTLDPDRSPLPEPLSYLSDHFQAAHRKAVVELAKRTNDLRRLDAFSVRKRDLDARLGALGHEPTAAGAFGDVVPWPAALAVLRRAKNDKAAAAYIPLGDRETGLSYEEKLGSMKMNPNQLSQFEAIEELRRRDDAPAFHEEKRRCG